MRQGGFQVRRLLKNRLWSYIQNKRYGVSLHNKLVLFIVPIVTVPLLLLGAFSYYKSSQVVQNQVSLTILENLSQVNYSLNYFVKDIEQLTMYIYRHAEIQDILDKPPGRTPVEQYEDYKKTSDILDSFLGFKSWDIQIYLLGKNGDRYFTGELLPAQYDDYNENWGHFRKMRLADGNVVWDTHYSMKKTDDFGVVLSSGRMLKKIESNEPIGYLVIDVMESALADKYNKAHLEPGGEVLLLDRSGYIISSTPSKLQIGTKFVESYVDQVLEGKKGFFRTRNADGAPVMVVYDTSEATGFKLISVVPVAALTKASASIRNVTVMIAGIGLVVTLWMIYLLTVHITRPLRTLRSLMFQVEHGNMDVTFATKHRDEVGQLGRSFNAMVVRIKQLIDEVYKKQLMVQEAEIKAIQAQFNPHFLYNALDTINWMGRIHKLNDISRMALSLGELLRFSIRKGAAFIPIREDMQQIHNYLFILKMRYGDKIEIDIRIDEEVEALYTPKLLIQPLVENAVAHGLELKQGSGWLRIRGSRSGDRVCMEVADNGVGMDPGVLERIRSGDYVQDSRHRTGIGLENLRKRLQLYFEQDFKLDIESRLGEGTVVQLEIPAIERAREEVV